MFLLKMIFIEMRLATRERVTSQLKDDGQNRGGATMAALVFCADTNDSTVPPAPEPAIFFNERFMAA